MVHLVDLAKEMKHGVYRHADLIIHLLASRDPSQAMMQKKAVSVEGSSEGCHVTDIKLSEEDHEPRHVSGWWKLRIIRHLFSQSSRKTKILIEP